MWRTSLRTARVCTLLTVLLMAAALALGAPLSSQELKAEHRIFPQDLLTGMPQASPDSFMWTQPDGSYRFGMQGQDQWRVESRNADGTVRGRYVYKAPNGQVIDVSYDSGPQGYRARGDAIPGGAAPLDQPVNADDPISLRQDQQSVFPTTDNFSGSYGALLLREVEKTEPSGDGVVTFSDDNTHSVVTDVLENKVPSRAEAVFPLVFFPGTSEHLVGPPLINNQPLLPGTIAV